MLCENGSNRVPRRLLARHIQKEDVMPTVSPQILPILMLFASNVFMTFAWYGHLKFKAHPLPLVIMASWGIAFFEYWLAVPPNRLGTPVYSARHPPHLHQAVT